MTTYTNPRIGADIPNWPHGRQRVLATFTVEDSPDGKSQRAVRVTIGKPVKLTYAKRVLFADGDDGRTYIINLTHSGFISVMRGDMKYQHETLFPDNPRFAEVRAFFNGGNQ